MHDPFPIAPIPALSQAIQPVADYFGLTTLPLHIHEVLLAAMLYQFIYYFVAPSLSNALVPVQYNALSKNRQMNWNVHVVSFFQSSMINVLALWVMFSDDERWDMDTQERVYGYTGAAAMIQALAAGYFLWDLLITLSNVPVFGVGMLAHAISALLVYSFGFRPFVNYYSTTFILWELSTVFLNIHWFFDKLGLTGTKGQLYNGFALIFTFFCCRLVWGTYQSYQVSKDVYAAVTGQVSYVPTTSEVAQDLTVPMRYESTMRFVTKDSHVPVWLAVIYLGANVTLNSLNFYWFFKMIDAVRKRFEPKAKEETEETEKTQKTGGSTTGVDTKAEIKGRPRRRTILDGEEEGEHPPPGI
ncbi:hypothetical protein PG993_001965 [Apiospora rasikravindrae]|uniref:TLC domain-containing protein n=1 Tax=Apiospora rasikravindrae TaxID=990691 RepID=A0ABR1UCW3_9PEZI